MSYLNAAMTYLELLKEQSRIKAQNRSDMKINNSKPTFYQRFIQSWFLAERDQTPLWIVRKV